MAGRSEDQTQNLITRITVSQRRLILSLSEFCCFEVKALSWAELNPEIPRLLASLSKQRISQSLQVLIGLLEAPRRGW